MPYQIQVLLERCLVCPHFRFYGNRSFVGRQHRGAWHLIAGDTVTGAVIVWIDFKPLNAIENVVMPDVNIRYNFIRTKLHRRNF